MFRNHGEEVQAALDGSHPALLHKWHKTKSSEPLVCQNCGIPYASTAGAESCVPPVRTYDDLVTEYEKRHDAT